MGIVAYCPHGHRVKVKDHLAGKKGICPTCSVRFRIPHASVEPPPPGGEPASLPLAAVVSLDAAAADRLPRAVALHRPEIGGVAPTSCEPAPVELETAEPDGPMHSLIADRPDLVWCHAVPGAAASEPMSAAAMQAWLEARLATDVTLVWRADWPDWRPIGQVFPEYLRR